MKKWNKVAVALLSALVMAATSVPGTALAAGASEDASAQELTQKSNTVEKANTKKSKVKKILADSQEEAAEIANKKVVKTASDEDEEKVIEALNNGAGGIYVETAKEILCVYCDDEAVKTSKVSGISYDKEKEEITLKGYKGGSIAVIGLDADINVASASTITLKGNEDWMNWKEDEDEVYCLYLDSDVESIKGSSKLTIKGSKYYESYDDGETWEVSYPEGIAFDYLNFENSNIYMSGVWSGLNGSDLEMYSGKIAISKAAYTAVLLSGDMELHGGKISGGYSLQELDDGNVLGKNGLYTDEDGNLKPSSKNAKTVTIYGGSYFSSDEDDNYQWTLNKGILTVKGEGEVGTVYDNQNDYGWDYYGNYVTSVVIGEGITAIDLDAFDECPNLKSITLPASLEKFYTAFENEYSALKEVKVNSKNKNFTGISGVLFSKDKKTLIYYPEGRTSKTYTIPNGTTKINEYALYRAPITTLVLPKTLGEIEAYEEGSWNVFGEDIQYIKITKGNTQFKLSNNMLLTADGKDLLWYAPAVKDMVIHIPEGVENIYADFGVADNLRCLYLPASVAKICSGVFEREEGENLLEVFFAGSAPTIAGTESDDAALQYLANGNVNIICDCSKDGWSAISAAENLNYKLIDCDDPDNYYPSKIWFDADEDGKIYVGAEEGNSVKLAYESEGSKIDGLIVTSSDSNGLKVSYDGEGTVTYEGLTVGSYTIQVSAINGVKATYKVNVSTNFEEESAELVVGESYINKLSGIGNTKVTYASSDSTVASVDKNGKVTAKKAGECIITAKFLGNEESYKLTIENDYPGNQDVYLSGYNYSGNYFVLTIDNHGKNSLIVDTKGAYTEDINDASQNRKIKSKGTITVKPGVEKDVKLYVNGSRLKYKDIDDYEVATVYFNFTYCGMKYSAVADCERGKYYTNSIEDAIDFELQDED